MYTILSSYPAHSSGNVGDKLLEEQTQELIRRETSINRFNVAFRERDFSATLEELNRSTAIILPAFAIREPIYPDTYRLADNLDAIEPPVIPLAANWNHYPGDEIGNRTLSYSPRTQRFLRRLYSQEELSRFTTRDIYTKRILQRHGFDDVSLVGDLAWYHEDYLGEEMRIPDEINRVVMTTPHNGHYLDQAINLLDMLIDEFCGADIICSFHSSLSQSDRELKTVAEQRGIDVVLASHDTENIEFYDECDLHVGYRLHGHLSFLRRRLPSVLIGEDGRGNGFNATLGVAGFQAASRRLGPRSSAVVKRFGNSLPGIGIERIARDRFGIHNLFEQVYAPTADDTVEEIRTFLQSELENDFSSYTEVPKLFDETYEKGMKPFLETLPEN